MSSISSIRHQQAPESGPNDEARNSKHGQGIEPERKQTLIIGKTRILYGIRISDRARKKRLVVTGKRVEVVVPRGSQIEGDRGVRAYVQSKRRWLYDAVREVEAQQVKLHRQEYASGAKCQYRGRWLMMAVASSAKSGVTVRCRSKLEIEVPEGLEGATKQKAVKQGLQDWLKAEAKRDLAEWSRRHAIRLGVVPKGARLSESGVNWGSCGKDGIIRVHWRLIQAPRLAMEYVVAHELVHLLHRNHGPAFWRELSGTLSNWEEAKTMLEQWEKDHRAV